MPSSSSPPRPSPDGVCFVVALALAGVHRGFAGPFPTEAEAEAWVVDELLDGEPGWTWFVEPVVAPSKLPTAARRRSARQERRAQLRVLPGGAGTGSSGDDDAPPALRAL